MKKSNFKSITIRTIALILSLTLVFCVFASCGKKEEEPQVTEPTVTTTESQGPVTDYNRLTGLDDLSDSAKGKRPVAIMINNIRKSLPQYGISSADLIFECLVEGGITRMMAVYADQTKIPSVCSVRSCRYYFPILANSLDAVYICFGCNPTLGKSTLKRLKIDYFDGNEKFESKIFGRDPERLKKYSREHTAFVKGANIPEFLDSKGTRRTYKNGKDDYIFNFNEPGVIKATSKIKCDTAKANFSNTYNSSFIFDKDTKTYKKLHTGKPHMDQKSGKQLSFTNVFLLETVTSLYKDNKLITFDLNKGGSGYYLTDGTAKKVKWTKKDDNSMFVVKDENGKEIKVNAGKSYIGFVPKGEVKLTNNSTPVQF